LVVTPDRSNLRETACPTTALEQEYEVCCSAHQESNT
jgi:hypothetical protein